MARSVPSWLKRRNPYANIGSR